MRNTERKYWANGIQARGNFYTFAASLLSYGVIIAISKKYYSIDFYKLK